MVQRVTIAPQGPEFSRFVMGYWAFDGLEYVRASVASFIEEHLIWASLPLTMRTFMAVINAKRRFGAALTLAAFAGKLQIVTKCGIATTARAENRLGHYITDRRHIILSAEYH